MGNKFLGAIIGFALGGPVGAAAGAAIGGFADQVKKNRISASQFEAMRQRINEAFEQEEATGVAMARLEERLGDEGDAEEAMEFLTVYARQTPDLLQQVYASCQGTPMEVVNIPVYNVIIQYFFDDHDVVPDSDGVLGLLDDVYLARRILERVLLTVGASPANVAPIEASNDHARKILGEQFAAQLDSRVDQTLQHPDSLRTFNWLQTQSTGGFVQSPMPYHGIDFKREMIRDSIRHDLAKDGLFL